MADDNDWDDSGNEDEVAEISKPAAAKKFDDESDSDAPATDTITDSANKDTNPNPSTNTKIDADDTPSTSTKNATKTTDDSKQNTNNSNSNANIKQNQKQTKTNTNKTKKPNKQVSKASKNSKNNKTKSKAKGNDTDSTTSSDSDSDEIDTESGNKKDGYKMPSYNDRYSEDNAILFGAGRGRGRGGGGARGGGARGGRGGGGTQKQEQQQVDNRVMLSGDVRLQSFPLGSQGDCIKLAKEVSSLINGKRYDGDINMMDTMKFVSYIIDGLVCKNSQYLDIVDINELKAQVDKIYNQKQKDLRAGKKKKKPIHKFGKKYVAEPGPSNMTDAPNQAGKHIDGQYNENDFDFLN